MEKIKVGIIGSGFIGQKILQIVEAMYKSAETKKIEEVT